MVDNTHIKINKAISLVICILLVRYSSSDYCWIWVAQHLVFITRFVRQGGIHTEGLLLKLHRHFKWGRCHYNSFITPFTSNDEPYIVMAGYVFGERGCLSMSTLKWFPLIGVFALMFFAVGFQVIPPLLLSLGFLESNKPYHPQKRDRCDLSVPSQAIKMRCR